MVEMFRIWNGNWGIWAAFECACRWVGQVVTALSVWPCSRRRRARIAGRDVWVVQPRALRRADDLAFGFWKLVMEGSAIGSQRTCYDGSDLPHSNATPIFLMR